MNSEGEEVLCWPKQSGGQVSALCRCEGCGSLVESGLSNTGTGEASERLCGKSGPEAPSGVHLV